MRYYDKKKRNSLIYKMKLWFLKLTFRDIVLYTKYAFLILFEFIIVGIGFIIILILPHFFH